MQKGFYTFSYLPSFLLSLNSSNNMFLYHRFGILIPEVFCLKIFVHYAKSIKYSEPQIQQAPNQRDLWLKEGLMKSRSFPYFSSIN